MVIARGWLPHPGRPTASSSRELFGEECMQCRSNQRETLLYTSWHKGLDPKKVCRELNDLITGK